VEAIEFLLHRRELLCEVFVELVVTRGH